MQESAGCLASAHLSAGPDVALHPWILRNPDGQKKNSEDPSILRCCLESYMYLYLITDLYASVHLQSVFAETFPHVFCSLGSQNIRLQTAAGPGTIPQMTVFHLRKKHKISKT